MTYWDLNQARSYWQVTLNAVEYPLVSIATVHSIGNQEEEPKVEHIALRDFHVVNRLYSKN